MTIQNLGQWTASLWDRYFGPRTLIEDNSIKSNSTTVFNRFNGSANDIT